MKNQKAKVIIYSLDYCPHCKKAKAFLDSQGVNYQDNDVTNDEKAKETINEKLDHYTFPKIIIDGEFIGGNSDMLALHEEGKLLPMLFA